MPGVTASLSVALAARLTKAAVGSGVPQFNATVDYALSLAAGTDAVNKGDILYQATRTLAASANEDLDLAGVLADALGTTITAAEILVWIIEADEGNTNNVNFGPTASVGALLGFLDLTDRIAVPPGGITVRTNPAGWAVTAATADKVNVANSGGSTSVTYTITFIGRTVAA